MKLEIAAVAARRIERGHPWLYRDAIRETRVKPAHGSVVDLVSEGHFVGRGIYDASSPLAVRIHTRVTSDSPSMPGALARDIAHAWDKREVWCDASTTAYRAVNGEGDRVPGVVVDRYGPVAVLRLDSDALVTWIPELTPLIWKAATARGIRSLLLRETSSDKEVKARLLEGEEVRGPFDVVEHGMTLEVDVLHGQKTGAFLDQRENRRRVRAIAKKGTRVLNLFSYAGGFSVAAALGGAREVTSVDIAAKAHATAQRTFSKNGVDPSSHRFVTSDASTYLAENKRGAVERFDLIVSDPPSFAPNEKSRARGLTAYAKLHAACVAVLEPRGVFCAASCSSHVTMEDFLDTLDDRSLVRADLSIRAAYGPPEDHPSLATFREGRYLKFVVLS